MQIRNDATVSIDTLDKALQKVYGPAATSFDAVLGKPVFSLTSLSNKLCRPKSTLEVLSRDPFSAGDEPARRRDAEWIAGLWRQYCVRPGSHLRRVHYILVSQAAAIIMPNGKPYVNDEKSFIQLINASIDARYLHLIPATDLVDRRNNPPIIYLPNDGSAGKVEVSTPPRFKVSDLKHVLRLMLKLPKILQRYHLEIWAEKTTQNDILEPLCVRYGVNLITGAGEQSLTACVNVVQRALANGGRPVRILYIFRFRLRRKKHADGRGTQNRIRGSRRRS